MEREAQRKELCRPQHDQLQPAGVEWKKGSEANQAGSFLGRLDDVELSMHKMLALLEQCLD